MDYHIHSNKRPGRLDKSFWVGPYLLQHLLHALTKKFMILAIFRLILSQIEAYWTQYVSFMNRFG